MHFLLLRASRQPSLSLPQSKRRLPHQAISQHERPVRSGGPTQEEEQTEDQKPQREHQLLQRGYGERGGWSKGKIYWLNNNQIQSIFPHTDQKAAVCIILWPHSEVTAWFWQYYVCTVRLRPPYGCCGSPCWRCHRSCCVCAPATFWRGSPSSHRPSSSPTSWDKSSTMEIPLYETSTVNALSDAPSLASSFCFKVHFKNKQMAGLFVLVAINSFVIFFSSQHVQISGMAGSSSKIFTCFLLCRLSLTQHHWIIITKGFKWDVGGWLYMLWPLLRAQVTTRSQLYLKFYRFKCRWKTFWLEAMTPTVCYPPFQLYFRSISTTLTWALKLFTSWERLDSQ